MSGATAAPKTPLARLKLWLLEKRIEEVQEPRSSIGWYSTGATPAPESGVLRKLLPCTRRKTVKLLRVNHWGNSSPHVLLEQLRAREQST